MMAAHKYTPAKFLYILIVDHVIIALIWILIQDYNWVMKIPIHPNSKSTNAKLETSIYSKTCFSTSQLNHVTNGKTTF